jgi:hypothetical protein
MRSTLAIALALLATLVAAPAASARTPILVVESAANPYSGYVKEILRAEGLNGFETAQVGSLTAQQLAGYDVVVLGDVAVTPAQASMFSGWVGGGGNLVALSPDPDLNGLLGIAPGGGALSDAYFAANTTRAPGAGITAGTMQYHGSADRYALAGATPVATLFSSASTATSNPAVTLRAVGTRGGEAAAFAFDVARSVSLTRQGNPLWAGQDRDGDAPIRTNDLFFGGTAPGSPPDWVNLGKIRIPQADELQRLLANVITYVNRDRTPVPRFWYLPSGENAAVVMTGDDHNDGGTAGRFNQYKAASPAGCSVVLWQCVRSTSYVYALPGVPTVGLTEAQVNGFTADGFEVAVHPTRGGCTNPDESTFRNTYTDQLGAFDTEYPSAPAPTTSRFHCVSWPDWSTHAKVEVDHGIRLDTNYYHYPPAWGDSFGYMTGSAEIMRFADSDGSTINLYQAHTHLNDEAMNPTQVGTAITSMLNAAVGAQGYYGFLTANMHTDNAASPGSDAIVAAAKARSVPVISARQALQWVQGRDASRFTDVTWTNGRLGFTVVAGAGATGLQGMVPVQGATGRLLGVSRNGVAVPVVAVRTIKGVSYAFFAAVSGRYEARYAVPAVPPRSAADVTAPRVKVSMPKRRALRKLLKRGIAFRVSCSEPCRVTVRLTARIRGRDVVLAKVRRILEADRRVRVVVKLKPRAARRLRRADPSRVKLGITAMDIARNTRTVTRRVRLTG